MHSGRTLFAGLDWAGTLGGLALCVLLFFSAYLAFDDRGTRGEPRRDEVIRLPSVPEADVPRVSLGRPRAPAGGGGAPDTLAPRGTLPSPTPVASPPPVGALNPPAPPAP